MMEKKKTNVVETPIPIDTPMEHIPYYSHRAVLQHSITPGYASSKSKHAYWHPTGVMGQGPWYTSSYLGFVATPPNVPLPSPTLPSVQPVAEITKIKAVEEKTKTTDAKKDVKKQDGKEPQKALNDVKGTEKEVKAIASTSLTMHTCMTCGKARSSGYHRDHPLIPGQLPEKSECGKCIKTRKKRAEVHYTDEETETEKKINSDKAESVKKTESSQKAVSAPNSVAAKKQSKSGQDVESTRQVQKSIHDKTADKPKAAVEKLRTHKLRRTTIILDSDATKDEPAAIIEHRQRSRNTLPSVGTGTDIESTRIFVQPRRDRGRSSARERAKRYDTYDERMPDTRDFPKSYLQHDPMFSSSFVAHNFQHSYLPAGGGKLEPMFMSSTRERPSNKSKISSRDSQRSDSVSQSSRGRQNVKSIEYDQSSTSKPRSRLQSPPFVPPATPPLPPRADTDAGDKTLVKLAKQGTKVAMGSSLPDKLNCEKDATAIPGVRYVEPRQSPQRDRDDAEKKNRPPVPSSASLSSSEELRHTCRRQDTGKGSIKAQSAISSAVSYTSVNSDKTVYPPKSAGRSSNCVTKPDDRQSSRPQYQTTATCLSSVASGNTGETAAMKKTSSVADSEATHDKNSGYHRHHRRTRYRYSRHSRPNYSDSETASDQIRLPAAERVLDYHEYHRETSGGKATPPESAISGSPARRSSTLKRPSTFTMFSNDSLGPRGYRYGAEPVAVGEAVSITGLQPDRVKSTLLKVSQSQTSEKRSTRDRDVETWESPVNYEPSTISLGLDTDDSVWKRDLDLLWENTKKDICTMSGALL